MLDQPPGWVMVLIFFLMVGTGAAVVAMAVTFLVFLVQGIKNSGKSDEDDSGGGWGGSGGWTNEPIGPPPGGGGGGGLDPDMVEFHTELDLIGKTIHIPVESHEEHEKPVLQ
jgi:hypothetical protein